MPIPKLLHQTWKNREVPREFHRWQSSWSRHHPDWEYRLWTDDDNRALIAEHYPRFLAQYDSYSHPIQRVDAARYFLLLRHGGLYVDLDFEALQPLDLLLDGQRCVLGLEAPEHARAFAREKIICNALMASEPEHPFLRAITEGLVAAARASRGRAQPVLESTGPFMLTRVYDAYDDKAAITLVPAPDLYPLSMDQADRLRAGQSDEHMKARLAGAFAVHFHRGTWWRS
jgi:mannosyltransferase OCH1-like enzyme